MECMFVPKSFLTNFLDIPVQIVRDNSQKNMVLNLFLCNYQFYKTCEI